MSQTRQTALTRIGQLMQRGEEVAALDALRKLIAAGPSLGAGWAEVLQLCERLGDEDAAAEAARLFGAADPSDPARALVYADKLARIGAIETSLQITHQFAAAHPGDPAIAYMHGLFLARTGALDAAEQQFRRALALKPDLADAWVQIGALRSFANLPDDIDTMRALAETGSDGARPAIHFALGKAYDDLGNVEHAWSEWQKGNDWLARTRPFDPSEVSVMRAAAEAFEPFPIDAGLGFRGGPAPIFIIGAPRTGTTLLEHILSAHPDVYALGESLISRAATWPVRHLAPQHIQTAQTRFGDALWSTIGQVYCHLAAGRAGHEQFASDKAAMLHMFVGVLANALPDARFIWIRRRTEAAALSAFRTYFTQGHAWSCNIAHAIAYLQGHDQVMRDWAERMGDRLISVSYEMLASQPDTEIDRVTADIGLRPDPGPKAFHLSKRPVETASFAQVRQPMNTLGIDAWRKYADFLPKIAAKSA